MVAIVGFFGKIFAAGFFKTVIGRIVLSTALGYVQSRIAALRAQQRAEENAGIRTQRTLSGSANSVGFVLGRMATGGQLLAPEYAHGENNIYNTYPISLGFIRGQTLNRLIVNGEVVELDSTSHATFGRNVVGKFANFLWVRYHDGSQTTVDPLMASIAGSHAERPWSNDMIGRETCIAYVTAKYDSEVMSSVPNIRFDVNGIPLYDLRKDSTAGGTGAHRFDNPATWEPTLNPVIMMYNIFRGVRVVGIGKWGGDAEASDFRFSEWSSAITKADSRYRAGFEVMLSDEPHSIILELMRSCGAQVADVGGIWRISVGEPDVASFFFSDDDLLVTEGSTFKPFPAIGDTYNTVFTTYVDPANLWETTEAPTQTDASYVASDDGRQLPVRLSLPAVFDGSQAQDLALTLLRDNRRFRSHNLTLPPTALALEPLDTVSWTSAENGYSSKLFEIGKVGVDMLSSIPQIAVRERDPADYVIAPGTLVPFAPVSTIRPVQTASVLSFAATPFDVSDGVSVRRPAIRLTWLGSSVSFADGVEYEVRTAAGAQTVMQGATSAPESGNVIIVEGILPNVSYEVRARLVAVNRDCVWSAWVSVTSTDVRIATVDLATPVQAQLADHDALRAEYDAITAGLTGTIDAALDAVETVAQEALLARKRGWTVDPTFTHWTGGNLTAANWADRSGTSSYATEAGGAYGGGLSINVPTGTGAVEVLASGTTGLVGADATADYVVAEIEATVTAADLTVARFGVEWSNDGTTWTRGTLGTVAQSMGRFADVGLSVKAGARQVVKTLWKRPDGVSGHIRYRLTAKTGVITTATQMVIHLADVRAATQADIDAGAVFTVATATPGQTTTAVGASAAIAALNSGVTARFGANEAAATATVAAQATVLAGINGRLAAAYDLKVNAGGAGAGLGIYDATGARSYIRLTADDIDLVGKVRASHLTVGAGLPTAINGDPMMTDPAMWSDIHPANIVTLTDGKLGNKALRGAGVAGVSAFFGSRMFPVNPAKKYRHRSWYRRSADANGACYIRVYWYNAAGAYVGEALSTVTPTTTWQELVAGDITPPPTATHGRLIFTPNNAGTAGYHEIQAWSFEEMVDGSLVVNGSITADKIAAGEVITVSMIVDGAKSRKVVSRQNSASVSASVAATAVALSNEMTVNFAPYAPVGAPNNPIQLSMACTIRIAAGSGPGKLVVFLQEKSGATWPTSHDLSLSRMEFLLAPGDTSFRTTANFSIDTGGNITTGTSKTYRFAAYRVVNTTYLATQIDLADIICSIEQVNL